MGLCLFSYSLDSPKTTPPPPSSAVKLSSSTGGVWKRLDCVAADDQFGGDLDLSKDLKKYSFQRRSRLKPPDFCQRDICFSPLAVFPIFLLWCVFFFFSPWCFTCIALFSTSVSYPSVVLLIRQMVLPLSRSFAPRIQKLLSSRTGHTYSNYIAMETLILSFYQHSWCQVCTTVFAFSSREKKSQKKKISRVFL